MKEFNFEKLKFKHFNFESFNFERFNFGNLKNYSNKATQRPAK